jgi:hypothetical protein
VPKIKKEVVRAPSVITRQPAVAAVAIPALTASTVSGYSMQAVWIFTSVGKIGRGAWKVRAVHPVDASRAANPANWGRRRKAIIRL